MKIHKRLILGLLLSSFFVINTVSADSDITLNSDISISNLTESDNTNIIQMSTMEGDKAQITTNVDGLDTLEIRMQIDSADNLEIDPQFNVVNIDNTKEAVSFFDVTDDQGTPLNDKVISEKIEGNDIVQSVDVSNVEGKVVATTYASTAFSYTHYFNWSKWITRDGKISLSISPKSTLTAGSSNPNYTAIRANDSWNRIVSRHSKDSNWRNTSGMKSQYICHYNWAKYKVPWNLEPWRAGTANAKNLCNP